MDPLLVFPPEIAHKIWNYLSPQDLLQARAVSIDWLASITSCPDAWVTDLSSDWHEFLEVKKTLRRWSSNHVRQEEIRNVRDSVHTEHAYYITFGDGILSMFNPDGEFVRNFDFKIHSLRATKDGLLITTHRPDQGIEWLTFVTDFAMNVLDEWPNVKIVDSFLEGFSYKRNDDYYFNIGGREIQCPPTLTGSTKHFILADCLIALQGLAHTSVWYYDVKDAESDKLHTFKASPLWIPDVRLETGPQNFFGVFVQLMHFLRIFVYNRKRLVLDTVVQHYRGSAILFTDDHLLIYHRTSLDIYPLANLELYWSVEIGWCSKIMRPFTWMQSSAPVVNNSYVTFNSDGVQFYRISGKFKVPVVLGSASVHSDNIAGCTRCYAFSHSNSLLILHRFELR